MKRDLIKYYKQLTEQYKDMLMNFKDIEATAEKDGISEDIMNELTEQVEVMKLNCDRLGYAMYLLQKPPFTLNKNRRGERSIIDYFKLLKADGVSVFNENKVALETIKSYIADNKPVEENKDE